MQTDVKYTEFVAMETLDSTRNDSFADILDSFGLAYQSIDFQLQVGGIEKVQGWILHLSAISSQLVDLLHLVIPELIKETIPFKIPKGKITARGVLDGNFGYEILGKVISIYPDSDELAVSLARKLVALTGDFRGPSIPTDVHLGGAVYTRYGSFNPVIMVESSGKESKCIYDKGGNLIKDPYSVPFQLPAGIEWPFASLASPVVLAEKKILHDIYKPVLWFKKDTRGDVIKALYLKKLFIVGYCVIKVGKKNMLSDDLGRDMRDRILWQRKLHNELSPSIPMPKILDYFEERGDAYLVMELIRGISLIDRYMQLNAYNESWRHWKYRDQSTILVFLQKIVSILEEFHQKGYVHRDIAPGNFMITKDDQLFLIDTELAYNIQEWKASPPFQLGTPGFMSPEQENTQIPTIKEDIYGLGAMMVFTFTSLPPIRFNSGNPALLAKNLDFFIGFPKISTIICDCLDHDPRHRPQLSLIKSGLEEYAQHLKSASSSQSRLLSNRKSSSCNFDNYINCALRGLTEDPMAVSDGIWMSKTIKDTSIFSNKQKDFSPYSGLHTGVGGVLYLLAKSKKNGFPIDAARENYIKNWEFVEARYLSALPDFMPGLYNGAAGLAVAFVEGINAGLLQDSKASREKIQACLNIPNDDCDLATGISGRGIAVLQCDKYIDHQFSRQLLDQFISILLEKQQKDGSWLTSAGDMESEPKKLLSLSHGVPGIIYFLLAYHSAHRNDRVESAARKGLGWLSKRTHDLKDLFDRDAYNKILKGSPIIGDERTGVLLCFIKSFEVLKDRYFKEITEDALRKYPSYVVNNNFTQETGMAGLGELYIEAWRVFGTEEWRERAYWIADVFIHTSFWPSDDRCYWLLEENRHPTADLLVGNGGIIHFLMRCQDPDKIGFILLE